MSVLILNEIFAQNTGRLRGFVTDAENGEALAYGNVFIEELKTGASTDEKGYYFITSVPANQTYTVLISYVGYVSKSFDVFIAPNKITELNVQLESSSVELEAVEKIGEKVIEKNATDIGLQRIAIRELEALPKGVETDVLRSLQYMPGVKSTGDVTARYYVRGGSSDQNLVLLNGATVYNPFHALGIFSVIDPEMINNVEFYKGGFNARFGDRLSSVLKVITKDGNKKNFGATASSSYITGKLLLEGPIPNGSFIFTGRKSYSNQILKKFLNNKSAPFNFYDGFFKLNYSNPDFIPNAKFEVSAFLSQDLLEDENPFKEDFKWKNNIFSFKWYQIYDSPFLSEFAIHLSQFKGEVIPKLSNSLQKLNEVNDVSMNFDFTYIFDYKDEVNAGIAIKSISTNLIQENQNGTLADLEEKAANISIYAKYNFLQYENFGLDIGTRLNVAGLNKNGNFTPEPRVSATYRPIPILALKAAWGIYQQEMTIITNENEVISLFEPWTIIPEYLEPARAIHYTGGISFNPLYSLTLNLEGYYKIIHNFPSLNENKKFTEDPDLVSGSGESYGVEFMTIYKEYPINATASYSLSYAYKEIDEWVYYPRYDSRHSVNLFLEYNFGAGFSASAAWSFSTGLPFTELIGFYDKQQLTNLFDDPNVYDNIYPYTILGDRNLGRLPEYHRLDLSLSKKFDFSFVKVDLDFSIINVYDRENIFYFKRDTAERVNMLPFLPTATIKVQI